MQRLQHLGADLSPQNDLQARRAVQLDIVHPIKAAAAAGEDCNILVLPALLFVDIDLQRLFPAGLEKCQDLVHPVAGQIGHLHRLQIIAGGRGAVLHPGGKQPVQLRLQRVVFRRLLRQGIKRIDRLKQAAREPQCQQRAQERH